MSVTGVLTPGQITAYGVEAASAGAGIQPDVLAAVTQSIRAVLGGVSMVAALGVASEAHVDERVLHGFQHAAARAGTPSRLVFIYLLPGSPAQEIRLRDPETGAAESVRLRPNGLLVFRPALEGEALSTDSRHAPAMLHGYIPRRT